MTSTTINIEDLLLNAAADATSATLQQLLSRLRQLPDIGGDTIADGIDLLLESWDTMSRDKAGFCLTLAELDCRDSALFRKVLTDAVKILLPPYLNKLSFIRALGLRNNDVAVKTIVARYYNLTKLKIGLIVFLEDSARWGKITSIDGLASSVAVSSLANDGALAVPLTTILDGGILIAGDAETRQLTTPGENPLPDGEAFRTLLQRKALTPIDAETASKIAFKTMVPAVIKADQFDSWWTEKENNCEASQERKSSDARSIHELYILLSREAQLSDHPAYSQEDCEKYASLLARVKSNIAAKETKTLAEIVSMLTHYGNDSQIEKIIEPLKPGAPFWPKDPATVELKYLDTWGSLKIEQIEHLSRATSIIFSPEYLAALATRLPLRSLNTFCERVDKQTLIAYVGAQRTPTCDILLWLWKNHKKYDNSILPKLFNIDKIIRTLAIEKLPRAWAGAQRELKKHLMDDQEMHRFIVANAADNISLITSAIHTANFLAPGEKQSLLIKLARQSPELKAHLEQGVGHKLVGAKHDTQSTEDADTAMLFTSPQSLQKLHRELTDITKIHIPENRASLKTARAHGDFRENAEYDAAKERRDFLSRRRAELERDLNVVQPLDFSRISVANTIVIGCQVTLSMNNGIEENYFLLGAWDGYPDKNYISYKSPLGAALLGRKLGEQVELPGNRTAAITKIAALPATLTNELAGTD